MKYAIECVAADDPAPFWWPRAFNDPQPRLFDTLEEAQEMVNAIAILHSEVIATVVPYNESK